MKLLLIIFGILFVLFFIFGNVKVNGSENVGIFKRTGACALAAAITTLIVGLPLLGIASLIGLN